VSAETVPAPEVRADGRHARRERNRLAVVDAMLELYGEGRFDPSSDEIAERAGLSPRSLFRYFDDLDDLVRAAIARQYERVRPLAEIDLSTDAPLGERVARLVRSRLRTYDAIAAAGKVARARAHAQPLVAVQLTQARALWRRQVERLFAPELAAMPPGRAAGTSAVADVLTSFESVQLMRDDQGLTRARIEAALTESLIRLLEA
jgi:AcrR family transcriptional regulator